VKLRTLSLIVLVLLSACGSKGEDEAGKNDASVPTNVVAAPAPRESDSIPGINITREEIHSRFGKFTKSQFDTRQSYLEMLKNEDDFFGDNLFRSQIRASNIFLRYDPEAGEFQYKSTSAVIPLSLAQRLITERALRAGGDLDSYTFWPVGVSQSNNRGARESSAIDAVYLVSRRCEFKFSHQSSTAQDFLYRRNFAMIVQYKLQSSFTSNIRHHLNVDANHLDMYDNPEDWNNFTNFLLVDILKIFIVDNPTGRILHESSC
jgi:hypothetical protein